MNFTQIIVARLGTEPDPFGWSEVLLVAAGIGLLIAVEFLAGEAIRKVFAWIFRFDSSTSDQADRDDADL